MKRETVVWAVGIVLAVIGLYGLIRLSGSGPDPHSPAIYSLSPGAVGMLSNGDSYAYDFASFEPVPTEKMMTVVQRYLDQQGNPDLTVTRLREFSRSYQADVVERSTGRHAFGIMLNKDTLQVSPKAGPNLFWNTKYGSLIAEVGGGYGMRGRLLPEAPQGEMSLTESEAQRIAQNAVQELDAKLKLAGDTAVFYGFYEFPVIRDGQIMGELDVNGYSGQVWYRDWGEPSIDVQDLLSVQ